LFKTHGQALVNVTFLITFGFYLSFPAILVYNSENVIFGGSCLENIQTARSQTRNFRLLSAFWKSFVFPDDLAGKQV
jgi:hypothetical protein